MKIYEESSFNGVDSEKNDELLKLKEVISINSNEKIKFQGN